MWNKKKLAGILVQTVENATVVGIGLNVNARQNDYENVWQLAISIYQITGKILDRNLVATVLYLELEKWYNAFVKSPVQVYDHWTKLAQITGKMLRFESSDGQMKSMTAQGIDENGFLWGYDPQGDKIVICSGELLSIDGRD